MIINSFIQKSILAITLAYGSVAWLSMWHQFGYGKRVSFPSISTLPRDTMIILPAVTLAIWVGIGLIRWLITRFRGRMSAWSQTLITACFLAALTTVAIILIEANQIFLTGIGNEVAIQVSLCRKILPDSSIILKTLLMILPGPSALRYHVLLQDGIYLGLFNVGITSLLMITLEGFARVKKF